MLLVNTVTGPHREAIPLVLDGKPAPIYYVCLEIRPEFSPKLPLLSILLTPLCHFTLLSSFLCMLSDVQCSLIHKLLNLPPIQLLVSSVSHLCTDHSFQFPSVLLVIRYTFVSSTAYQNINTSVSQSLQETSQGIFQLIYLFGECKACLKLLKWENQEHKTSGITRGKCQTRSGPYCQYISALN